MIKIREDAGKLAISVDVIFRDDKGKEITRHDETYKPIVSVTTNLIGMLLTCGSNVESAMEDIRALAEKLAMQMVVEGG